MRPFRFQMSLVSWKNTFFLQKMNSQSQSLFTSPRTASAELINWSIVVGTICIPVLVALLRFIFYPAWISRFPIEYEEEVLLVPQQRGPVVLSLVIPAYNEESRLLAMFEVTFDFIRQQQDKLKLIFLDSHGNNNNNNAFSFEFVIVDDGSTDRTCSVIKSNILSLMKSTMNSNTSYALKLIRLKKNRGKGAAVKMGVLCSAGQYILMVDADGATDIRDLFNLISAMKELHHQQQRQHQQHHVSTSSSPPMMVAFGSRAHLQDAAIVERSKVRIILMRAFHMCVAMLCSRQIRDTQCGFKLFTCSAANMIFSNLHLQRWAFDIEVVTITELLGIPIVEVGVRWKEVDGSKLDTGSKWTLMLVSLEMLRDMICVRLCYTFGLWNITDKLTK